VTIVSALGRGETLALALHENGFQVQILDFSPAFPPEIHRGVGPFPVVNKTNLPAQRDLLKHLQPLPEGLSLWLKDGPLDLTGPMSEVHALSHPELKAWKAGGSGGEFGTAWLERWLRQWAAPFFSDSWLESADPAFPATQPLGLIPAEQEERATGFTHLMAKGVDVRACTSLREVRVESSRLEELDVECGMRLTAHARQWVWCLSSHETEALNAEVAKTLFWRGVWKPEWAWVSFEGLMKTGVWSEGLPTYTVVVGDVYLPWAYANAFVLRRIEGGRFRVWLKVPRVRVDNIDARRGWGLGVENLLRERLAAADWRIDSGAWSLCAHSEIFSRKQRGEAQAQWKNWDWISPENLPRLDLAARLEREAECYNRLAAWRNDNLKKQGVSRDRALHAP
jgi:hypothetical protein